MRVGIIGLGRAGKIHLEAWRALPFVEVGAIADSSPSVRRSFRSAGCASYDNPLEMVARERLDAVSICTPPAYHAPVAIACLERGIDVLCEKPLATTPRTALRMLQTAARLGRKLLLATKFRHVADVIQARDLIAGGEIGEPIAFEIDFSSMVDMSQRWNSRRVLSGGGVIIDNGCHAFDIVAFLFGTVSRVRATRLKQVQDIPVEDSATVLVHAGQGLLGRIDLSWSLTTGRDTYVRVYGSNGTIDVGWKASRLRRTGKAPVDIGPGYDKAAAHRCMMRCFTEVVAGSARPWISPGECLRTVAAVEATYRALREGGGWVTVDMMGMRERTARRAARA